MHPCLEPPFQLMLQANAMFTIGDADRVGIECRAGSVWITLDHDLRDVVIGPGEGFCHVGHARALLFALETATIEVRCARAATLPTVPASLRRWRWPRPGRLAAGLAPA